jgi:IS30 family transposase
MTRLSPIGLLQSMRAMATWFCDAYAAWQKGGVENANGRLRRWLPRHIDIDRLSDEEIQDIVIIANLTPRKCLGFKTPFQAILKEQPVALRARIYGRKGRQCLDCRGACEPWICCDGH